MKSPWLTIHFGEKGGIKQAPGAVIPPLKITGTAEYPGK
jgi:hypothetical protein